MRTPLLLLPSRCSAVVNRRPLVVREVACRSSKEKAAPRAGDQSVRAGTLWFLTSGDSDTAGRTLCALCSTEAPGLTATAPLADRIQGHYTLWYFHQDGKLTCLDSVKPRRMKNKTSCQNFQNETLFLITHAISNPVFQARLVFNPHGK